MIQSIIRFSVRNKLIIGLLIVLLVAWGGYSFTRLPIDAVPDITNNQVQVVTVSPSLAPEEVEKFITQPVERNLANLQGVTETRSISRYGLSVITVVFRDDMPVLNARQLVSEKLQGINAEIDPALGTPELMPITTGLGEIYQYTLQVKPGYEDRYDLMELRTIQDWIVKKQLAGLEGVVEISSFGGLLKQYEVELDPKKLALMDVTVQEVITALESNNQSTGGSYTERGPNAIYIRSQGMIRSLEDIRLVPVKVVEGVPVLIRDVATQVHFGSAKRFGAMTKDGKGEVVGGITLMLKGANSSDVVDRVKQRMVSINKALPEGVEIVPFIDRSALVKKAIHTVSKNLIEGGLIVIFVLVLLLGNFRAGIIVASVIPLSMLFALGMMNVFGVSANLMSLGALDFGLIVDGAVVIVEGVVHQLHKRYPGMRLRRGEMDETVEKFSAGVMNSAVFGQVIILIVYLPILALVGVEGKMFRPMAMTVSFAIVGALLLSVTYVPMISAFLLSKNIRVKRTLSDRIMEFFERMYAPVIRRALRLKPVVVAVAVALLAGSVFLFTRLGSVFIPTLEEGDLAMQMTMKPGTSLQQVIATTTQAEDILLKNFPEVRSVVSKIGTAEVPTDPMGMEDSDIMILLNDKSEWTSAHNREDLVAKMKEKLAAVPGASFEFSQPIQLRFNELMTGSKADLAIKIFGEDMDTLFARANEVKRLIADIPGAADIRVEQVEGLPQLTLVPDRQKAALYGVSIADINQCIRSGFAGEPVGKVYEGERRFEMVVRYSRSSREDLSIFNSMYLRSGMGTLVPLSQVTRKQESTGPMLISHDNGQRRIVIGINVRNRDIQSLVDDIRKRLDERLDLPDGYYIRYGGEFEKLQQAGKRLSIAVPVALALIFLLLYFAFRSVKQALMIYSAVPLSAIGGVLALWIRGMPFSISAGVGFIALFGVAVLNGIVLIGYFNQLEREGMRNRYRRVLQGTHVRLRPVLMTAAVASLGFLPMAMSTSAGGEVQQPLATVVIGGLISATLLTLIVLPVIYLLFDSRKVKTKGAAAAAVLLFIGLSAQAQQPVNMQPRSLDEMVKYALEHNTQLENARLDEVRSRKNIKSAWDIGNTEFGLQRGQINSALVDNYWSVMQNFGNPVQQILQAGYLREQSAFTGAVTASREKMLTYTVSSLYYELVLVKQKLRILDAEKQIITEYNRISQVKYAAGETDRLGGLLADNRLGEFAWEQKQLELRHDELVRQLRIQTCSDAYWIPVEDSLMLLPFPDTDTAKIQHPYLSVLEARTDMSRKNIRVQSAAFSPTLNAGYFNQQLDHINNFQGFYLGVGFPIFFASRQSAIQTAKIDYTQSVNELDYARMQYREELVSLQQQLVSVHDQLQFYRNTALPNALYMQQQSLQRFTRGEIDYVTYWQLFAEAQKTRLAYADLAGRYNQLVLTHQYVTGK